jgi:hypothetical protein
LVADEGITKIKRLIVSQYNHFFTQDWWTMKKYEDKFLLSDFLPTLVNFLPYGSGNPIDIVHSSTTIDGFSWTALWHIHYVPVSTYVDYY